MSTAVDIVATIRAHRYRYTCEDDLQVAIAHVLTTAGHEPVREVRLGAAGTIDLMCDRVGIECKVGGSATALIRQLHRYATSGRVSSIVVVSSRAHHVDAVRGMRRIGIVPVTGVIVSAGL